jgi:hypothetical protein
MSTDLTTTFLDAERFFNDGNWEALAPLLHENVIMWHVDDRQKPIMGKSDVMDYLTAQAPSDRSQFWHLPPGPPAPGLSTPGASTISQTDASGVIQGVAYWKDKRSDPDPPHFIRYVFVFERDSTNHWTARQLKGWL